MPEINVDDSKWPLYRQCEIRRPSEPFISHGIAYGPGYFYDIVWIKAEVCKKGTTVTDGTHQWFIFETFGTKKMAGGRWDFEVDDREIFFDYALVVHA